jgi:hypothetical protein
MTMSPLNEEFLDFQSAFGNPHKEGEDVVKTSQADTSFRILRPESRIQPKQIVSGDNFTQVTRPSISSKPRYKWLLWSAPVVVLLVWWKMQLNG